MAKICCKGQCFENIQAVLFDKDGTLANVEDYLIALGELRSHQVAAHAPDLEDNLLKIFGIRHGELDPTGLMAVGSRSENKVAIAAQLATAGYGWIEALTLVEHAFQQAESALPPKVEKTVPIAGAVAFLRQLSQVGIILAIVSSDTQPNVEAFIRHYQLPNIRWCCGAATDTLPKTHSDFLTFACESIDADPAETLIVGDSAADFTLARQGAAGFLGMTGGWRRWHPVTQTPTKLSKTSSTPLLDVTQADLPAVTFHQFDLVESFI